MNENRMKELKNNSKYNLRVSFKFAHTLFMYTNMDILLAIISIPFNRDYYHFYYLLTSITMISVLRGTN